MISDRKGNFLGMLADRTFDVTFISAQNNAAC